MNKRLRDRQGLQRGRALQVEGTVCTEAQRQRRRVCEKESCSFCPAGAGGRVTESSGASRVFQTPLHELHIHNYLNPPQTL